MTENDKNNDLKVPRFDSFNKSLSRDTRIKAWTQAVKCAAMAKFGMKGATLFQALYNTKPGDPSPMLHFARAKKIAKTAPLFYKMVTEDAEDEWFKMQVWLLQYLIRDFKESDSAIIDDHDPEVFKLRLVQNDGWDADGKHVRFAPFATICFHAISKRYLEQTSSHLIGKLKSFVMARTSFGKHVKNPLKWTSSVEAAWHDLQGGIKRFDPEALAALELVLDIYNSGDHQWSQWATSFYEQHNDRAFTVAEVLQSVIDRHGLHSAVSAAHHSSSHSTGKHLRDHTAAVNMIEELVAKDCASCGKQFKPKAPQHKMCDGCFNRRDKKAPRLSSADTSVTMTPAAKESFNQRRKFKSVKKNAKRWSKQSSKKGEASSSSGPPAKKGKSGAVNMITSFEDEGPTERASKKARLASDIEDADQSADDESDNDLQLAGAASSSKQGGVMSRGKRDDSKSDPRDSAKTRLKARGPRYGLVLRPEGAPDFYDSHLCCAYEYTGPFKKPSEPAAKPAPVISKKVSRKALAGKEVATSSDNEGSTERPAKKARTASSASVMHVQPLRGDDDDDHNLLLSTLTGGHGVFMAEAEVNKIEDLYDSDNEQAQVIAFVDASYAGPVNIVPDYRLAIEQEMLQLVDNMRSWQLVDSGANVHIAPDYVVNAVTGRTFVAPIRPVPVINLADYLLDDEEDDDENGWDELPELMAPEGPLIAPEAALLGGPVPVLDLIAFLLGVDVPAELLSDGPALNLDPTLGLDAAADLAGPLTLISRPYGLRFSPQQWRDLMSFQEVPPHVASSNGDQGRRFSELRTLIGRAFYEASYGQVYMVYQGSAAATASRHSCPETFNDLARQHIGRPERILRDLQFPAPAFWLMADSGATVNVVWDTELTSNFRARSHALRGFQGMASFAIGEAFLDVLVLAHVQNEGWSVKHLSSGDYDTWVVPDARIQILSLTTLTKQGHVVRIGGPTSGIFVAGRRDTFIPLFKDDRSGYYVLPVKAPSFRAAGLKADITLQRRPPFDGSVLNVATDDDFGEEPPAASLATPSSSVPTTTRKRTLSDIEMGSTIDAQDAHKNTHGATSAVSKVLKNAALAKHVQRVHEKLGHVDLKRIFKFKRHGKVVCANLPPRFLKEYRQACPICLATKRRRRSLPKSADNKAALALLKPWEVTHFDVSGPWRVPSSRGNRYYSLFVCGKRGAKLLVPHRKKTGAQQAYVKFITRIGSHPKTLYTDFGGEICSNEFDHFLLANGVQHVVVPKGEHHANGPAEKGIGDIDRMTKAIMADKNIPSRFWDILAEHCVLINAITSPAVDEPTKTIFEACYGQAPDYDALPPVGCYAVRLLEKQHRKDFRFGLTNQPGVFLGYATYNNIYGAVLFAEKALVVGRLQIAFDPNFFPFIDKKSDNPRYKFLHALLGRGSDAIDTAADNADCGDAVEVDLQDPSSAPNPPSDPDDAVSSDDDDATKALLSELLQSSPVPAFNPLRADPLPVNQVPYPAAATVSANGIKAAAPQAAPALLDRFVSDEVQDVPLRRGDRSRKEPPRITTRVLLKSATSGKPLASPRPPVTAKSLAINKTLLVGRKLKRFFPTLGNYVAKVSMYNPDTDSYRLFYPVDNHEEWLPFSEVVKLLPKSWARDEEQANIVAICYALTEVVADEKLSTDPAQAAATYTEPIKYQDALIAPDRVLWKAALDLEYGTLERMGCWRVVKLSTLPPGVKPITCKWVLKLKFANGVYEKHKARIVARGFEQRKGVDYFHSFSPTASQVSLRLVLALTASPGFLSVDLDATSAFISAPLQDNEQVYMTAVPGYPLPPGHCLHVVKSIYGLATAPLAFYNLCVDVFTKVGLQRLRTDECVFIRYAWNIKGKDSNLKARSSDLDALSNLVDVPEGNRVYASCPHSIAVMIVVQYVDNSGIRYNCRELVDEFYAAVRDDGRIDLNFVGGLTWWLGVRYTYDLATGAVSADQEAFIDKLLEQYAMTNCNACVLPMAVGADLASIPLPDVPDKDIVAAYAKLVGELLYISINTVPEIMYALSALTRFMTRATSQHYGYAKQVLRYLKGVKHLKLTWCARSVKAPFQRGQIFGFADASWADDKSSRRSTLCYVLCCNGAAFSWKSALAPILALSTSEAELISVASCAQEVNFCRKLATELGFIQPGPTPIAEDNTGAIALLEHGHFKGRSKHVHLRWCFVCDYVNTGVLRLVQTPTRDQLADIGTKACPAPQLKLQRSLLRGGL